MVDRFLVWVGVSLVTAGMSMAMLTGAGLAIADDGTASGTGADTSAGPSNSTGAQQDSTDTDGPSTGTDDPNDPKDPDSDDADKEDGDGTGDQEPVEEEPAEEPGEEPTGEPDDEPAEEPGEADTDADGKDGSDSVDTDRPSAPVREQPTATVADDVAVDDTPDDTHAAETPAEQPADPPAAVVEEQSVDLDIPAAEIIDAPEVAAVAFATAPTAASAVATAPPLTALLDVIGTVVFNLYALATRLVGGPPILPPGSSVTVRSSTLRIDCGCADGQGFDVPADWYFPNVEEGEDPPERLIYLQHGFLASGPWYSHTAAALAEQTNSIVVAPSITSNFLDADACWLGAAPMHEALAKLFDADNTALADSAAAAGYAGAVPTRVVLMGHSLGGGAVSGMAGHMALRGSVARLAGVVLLDGVGLNGKMADDLDSVPNEIPIYQLAAPKYFWNQFGVGTDALLQARPDAPFIGLTLAGGAHVDTMVGGNPLIQFAQQLVSGFSTPQNVAAARQIMVGWVNDMFDPDAEPTGIYEDDLDEPISTPAGDAFAVALPNELTKQFILNFLQPFVALGDGIFTFEPACVAASVGRAGGCTDAIAA